ncbi:M3 family oligoendopeptidase [Oscillospiraceae bacterium HV4-5-C5C]|nr:M3 family oligoendopeptidase [Oscillospiraceae bacterium HV4-5-C5C]
MMDKTFSTYQYQRPDMTALNRDMAALLAQFAQAGSAPQQIDLLHRINRLNNQFDTAATLCQIRHSINTRDSFYRQEQAFFDENQPIFDSQRQVLYQALCDSPFRPQLEKAFGPQLFALAQKKLRSFSDRVIPLLQQENRLVSRYDELIASARIPFQGQSLTLAQLDPYTADQDRTIRQAAVTAKFSFFTEQEDQLDQIYDEMVKVRTDIAHQLGYDNFIQLAYDRLGRTDYGPEAVADYRRQIVEVVVPLRQRLEQRQARRIGLDRLKFYDEGLKFNSGNARPQGGEAWCVEQARQMYTELSPETGRFFDFMSRSQLMDLPARDGKASGGYCTFIPDYKAPFIFANFNGTSGDVDTLTHEAGHAFQVYESRGYELPEYIWPTLEACEIHSMSMEFFTWPWMQCFFGPATPKFCFAHLAEAVSFIPYGALVDAFQHRVYAQPELGPQGRKQVWHELEQIYLPARDYDGLPFLERGGLWMRQGHIFGEPFYYIDYTLAQVLALQFWQRDRQDHPTAWADYVRLCQAGGSLPFLELVKLAGLKNPFSQGTLAHTLKPVMDYLDAVDDLSL